MIDSARKTRLKYVAWKIDRFVLLLEILHNENLQAQNL